jgi:tRNA pseudouridine55 synthase
LLDKPAGMSSASAVENVKRGLRGRGYRVERAGHGGTLDPMATGVLPICLDEATKLASYLLNDDKGYEAEVVLGVETDTLDRTGTVVATRSCDGVTRAAIEQALAARTGEHDQVPPMYSAIKQGGIRLYKRARAGEEVERTPRRVRIDSLELIDLSLDLSLPRFRVAIACGKGTYVRSLVADLGNDLGCGAHLSELRRTRSGVFTIGQAQALDALDPAGILPLTAGLRLPVVMVPAELAPRVISGVQLASDVLAGVPGEDVVFQMVDESADILAIARVRAGRIVYDRVFPTA